MELRNHKKCKLRALKIRNLQPFTKALERYFSDCQKKVSEYLRNNYLLSSKSLAWRAAFTLRQPGILTPTWGNVFFVD